jgi:hypothetical protein
VTVHDGGILSVQDVHVMPNDGKHIASPGCPCTPKEDDETRRLRAQGLVSARVWVHHQLS